MVHGFYVPHYNENAFLFSLRNIKSVEYLADISMFFKLLEWIPQHKYVSFDILKHLTFPTRAHSCFIGPSIMISLGFVLYCKFKGLIYDLHLIFHDIRCHFRI